MALTNEKWIASYQDYGRERDSHSTSLNKTDIDLIKGLVVGSRSKTILDFGSGHGNQYKNMRLNDRFCISIDNVYCYDIGIPEYAVIPDGQFDGVISTDVLEHIPEEFLDENIKTIFEKATKFVYIAVHCGKSIKTLSDGSNAHCTIHPPRWWSKRIKQHNKDSIPLITSYRIPI